jgi:predicted esterase
MRMTVPIATVALAAPFALGTAAAQGSTSHLADGSLGDWVGKPTMLAGRSQISKGELVYTDYLYDDYGPDVDHAPNSPQFRSALAPKSGDYGYPDDPDRYGYNAADLRELRIAVDRDAVHALVALQTMKVADASIATIAIDADGNPATGSGSWPDGAQLRTPGADHFITVWGTGARLTDAAGHRSSLHEATNTDANAFEVDVPRGLMGTLSNQAKVWVGVGLAASDGTYMNRQAGATPVYDIGFQGAETYGYNSQWSDQRQSAALAGGDISDFAGSLPTQVLVKGQTRPFQLVPGYYNRIFRSGYSYGEGITLKQPAPSPEGVAGTADPEFLGPFQPYGLYIPQGYDRRQPTPLLLDGHSLDVNLNEYKAVGFNQLSQLGDERGSIIITPLARGIDTWYLDAGLIDVFEAWRDAKAAYNTDADRTSITGYSMGGYMTYRLGLLMPDAFARAAVYVGPPAYYHWDYPLPVESTPYWQVRGNTNLIVDNGLDLPFEINHGNADELVPISGVVQQANTFKAAGDPYRFYHHVSDDHLSFILTNQWQHTRDWLGVPAARRNLSPVRVRYKRYPSMDLPHANLVFDGAYWIDAMVVRNAPSVDSFGEVNATTFALGGNQPTLVDEGTTTYLPGQGGSSPATVTGQHYADGAPIQRRNSFEATLTNLRSLLFLTGRMGLDPNQQVTATLSGDGTTVLRFSGAWPANLTATVDGSPVPASGGPNGATVTAPLPAGQQHLLAITPG